MSFTNSPRGSRSGGRAAGKKSTKKKKQDFHSHRKRPHEEAAPDLDSLKTRVVSALDHLGHQKLSNEPGGYDLQSWVKSLNLLLDDFQGKVEASKLPPEYYRKRAELAEGPFKQIGVTDLDTQIEALRREEVEERDKIEKERQRITERIAAISIEKDRDAQALEGAKRDARTMAEKRESTSFFGRLLGRNRAPSEGAEQSVAKLDAEIKGYDTELATLQASLDSLEPRGDSEHATQDGQSRRLPEIQKRLTELGVQREERMQLSRERETLAAEIAKIVSELPGSGSPEGQTAPPPAG